MFRHGPARAFNFEDLDCAICLAGVEAQSNPLGRSRGGGSVGKTENRHACEGLKADA
jgi:hypothetical protein